MTTKKKVVIGVVAAWIVLGSLFWAGAGGTMRHFGGFHGFPSAVADLSLLPQTATGAVAVATKDFEPLELVFVTVTAKKAADVDVTAALLKEAQKLGGHGVVNVKVATARQGLFKGVTVTGSALAVKYTEAVGVPVERIRNHEPYKPYERT
jgi:hypothetical protein